MECQSLELFFRSLLKFIIRFTQVNLHLSLNFIECGGILKTAPGTLNMPGMTASYRYNKNCTWVIRAPPDHAIQLTWLSFPTQKSTITDECYRNYIEVIEGYGTSNRKSLGK